MSVQWQLQKIPGGFLYITHNWAVFVPDSKASEAVEGLEALIRKIETNEIGGYHIAEELRRIVKML